MREFKDLKIAVAGTGRSADTTSYFFQAQE